MDNSTAPAAVPPVVDTGYNSPAPEGTGAAAPAAQPVPVPTSYSGGGKTGFAKFIDGVTITDVVAFTLFFGLLGLGIVYYRRKIKYMKSEQAELISKVDDLEEEVQQMKGGQQPSVGFGY